MKRPLILIALMVGSTVLPLQTGYSLAWKPLLASKEQSVQRAKQQPKRVLISVSKTVKVPAKIPSKPISAPTQTIPSPSPTPSPSPRPVFTLPAHAASVVTTPTATTTTTTDRLHAVNKAQMQDNHRALAKMVLGMLPPECQQKLRSFSVLYNNPKHRGLAGNGVIILSGNVPDEEFIGLLLHEGLGHFAELTCFEGDDKSGDSPFLDGEVMMYNNDPSVAFYRLSWTSAKTKKSDARDADFVSGYAKADIFEDIAESIAYYYLQEEAFEERAQTNQVLAAKLAWLRTYYPKNGKTLATGAAWNGKIPWDATKVTYRLASL